MANLPGLTFQTPSYQPQTNYAPISPYFGQPSPYAKKGSTWDLGRQLTGNAVEWAGNKLGVPETGVSEWIAGGVTPGTVRQASANYDGATNPNDPNQQPPQSNLDYSSWQQDPKYQGWSAQEAEADFAATGGSNSQRQPSYDPYAALRSEISSGWDSYLNSLGGLESGLMGQRTAQEGIAQNQYDQGVNQLGLQKTQGLQTLDQQRQRVDQNQVKTLRDLSANVKNSFMAGNIYLGARGAGDSSAANQYSYALTKQGNRQRSDVMGQTADIKSEIDGRETNLNNIYNSEVTNLGLERDTRINQVADWFNAAQNKVKELMASGQLGKSQDLASLSKDILNQALAEVQRINQETSDRRSALESWAMTNSKNIAELRNNMGQIAQFSPNLPGFTPVAGQPQVDSAGNFRVAAGYGGGSDEQQPNSLFQNPTWG
jgi:hypothetical protein